jgi:DNA polymerase-3 subunit gamma/tau
MRDAESIMDQLASFCDRKMKLEDVSALLGMVEEDILFDAAGVMIDKNSKGALELVQKILDEGKDLVLFMQGLIEHFRNLMVCNFGGEKSGLIDLPEERIKKIKQQSQNFTIEDLLYILNVLAITQEKMKFASSVRIPLEIGLVKLTMRENMISLTQILDKLEKMEKNGVSPDYQVKDQVKGPTPSQAEPIQTQEEPVPPDQGGPTPVDKSEDSELLNQAKHSWHQIVDKVKQQKISCGTFLEAGQPVSTEGNKLLIGLPRHAKFNYENLQIKTNTRIVEKAVHSFLGQDIVVEFVLTESSQQPAEPTRKQSADEPIVKSALDIFNGGVTKVE